MRPALALLVVPVLSSSAVAAPVGGSLRSRAMAVAAASVASTTATAPVAPLTPTPAPTPGPATLSGWVGTARAIDLPTLLQLTMRQSPALATAKLDIAIAEAAVAAQTGVDDWRVSADLTFGINTRSIAGLGATRQTDLGLSGSLLRVLPTGGTVGLHASTSLSDTTISDHAWTDTVSASITQPLLRGYGRAIARVEARQARIAKSQADRAAAAAAIDVVQRVVAAYWELVSAERELAISQASLELARERLRLTQAGIAGGKVAPSEALAVEQIIATRQEAVLGAELGVLDRSITVRRAAGMEVGPDELALAINVTPSDAPPPMALAAGVAAAIDASPELAQLALADENATISVELADNGLLPQLDASLQVGPSGRGSFGRAFANMVTFDELAITAGLSLEADLGQRAPRAQARRARLEREQVLVNAADVRAQIAEAVARALAQAELARQRLSLSRTAIDLAMRNIGIEQSRFELGKSTSFDVLQRQDELRAAQLREARAQIDGQLAALSMSALTGDILAEYGVELPSATAVAAPTTTTSGR